ncbi:MAG: hypothetical protein K0S32_4081 [Bacteroidetes bacterium]|nr:hypothetical protein [Bacteroidota bacterium]
MNAYGISSVSGATSYSWTISPPNAASIASGQGSNNIILNTSNQNFVLTVTPKNSCGSGGSSSLNVALDATIACANAVLFAANNTNICAGSMVVFTNYTNPNLFMGLTPVWNFGSGASPATATGNGPHNVTYSTQGLKTVTLDYVDAFNNSFGNETKTNYVNVAGSVSTSAITGSTSVVCNATGLIYQVSNTTGSSYNWNVPSGATIVSGQGTNSIVMNFGGNNGNVTVTETNFGGCVGTPVSLGVSCIVTGIEKNTLRNGISIFPNPVTNVININSENEAEKEIIIMNAEGKVIHHESRKEKECTINTSNLAPGFYFLRLSSGPDTVTFKIIKL